MHESSKAHSSSRPFFEADGRAGSARKGGNETQQAPAKESSPMSPNANPTKSAGHRTMARLKLEHERALDEYADYLPLALALALAPALALALPFPQPGARSRAARRRGRIRDPRTGRRAWFG